MKWALNFFLCAALGVAGTAQARTFNQAELDALLAPIALYPDPVLSNVLDASQYPDEVRAAAAWTRENAQLKGDDALRALGPAPWQPSVKALTAFPDLLARMDESPDWLRDLGDAYKTHGPYVMDTVQQLRQRAQANGNLQSNPEQRVYNDGGAVVVQPAYPGIVYVPYYDPFVVYGAWWWPAYRPVVFRPWPVHRVFVSHAYFPARCDWRGRQVVVDHPVRPAHVVNHPANFQGGGFVPHPPPTQWRPGPSQTRTNWRGTAPAPRPLAAQAPRPQFQTQVRYHQPTANHPVTRNMVQANWRAESRPQFQNRGMSRPQGGTHAGRRG